MVAVVEISYNVHISKEINYDRLPEIDLGKPADFFFFFFTFLVIFLSKVRKRR